MAKSAAATELLKLVKTLKNERADHVKAIEAIDRTFQELGIGSDASAPALASSGAPKRRGRPVGSKSQKAAKVKIAKAPKAAKAAKTAKAPKAAKTSKKTAGKRSRGSFGVSGDASVLGFVKGNAKCTTAQVNAHWTKEGRAGKADNALGKLVREGKITRKNVKGQRGSTYSAK
ncbi:MAG: hypothetical protein JKX85_09430 [Phycisphaeraceae bacterium]|nr:hypothetical protein [Phycisphaeraceae bacterium]